MISSSSSLGSFGQRVARAFAAMVQMLNEQETTVPHVAITMSAPFECIDLWAYQSSWAPRGGCQNLDILDDPGLTEKEAFPVYEALDKVFNETFPLLVGISRANAALHVQWLMRGVSLKFIEVGQDPKGTEEYDDLLRFSEGVVHALNGK